MSPDKTERHRTPTISDVARDAGVSRSTVSRAFSHPELLSPATVEKVVAVAARTGYVPNQTARALSTGRSGILALVVPDITNPFFAAVMRGAQARARDLGYATFLGDSDERPDLEDVLLTRFAPQVEGFILASSRIRPENIRGHAAARPLVLMNRDITGVSRLLVDAAGSYERAVEHLAELGHSSIAYVNGPEVSWSNRERRQAVLHAAERLGVAVSLIPSVTPTYEAGQECVGALLHTGATAFLAFDDVTAQGIMSGLAIRGLSVPEDFSVVGCDGVLATMTHPPLTSIEVECRKLGELAVDMLMELLNGKPGRRRTVIPTRLVVRSTTAASAQMQAPASGAPRRTSPHSSHTARKQ